MARLRLQATIQHERRLRVRASSPTGCRPVGDPRYFWYERAITTGEEVSLTWYDIGDPLLIHARPKAVRAPLRRVRGPDPGAEHAPSRNSVEAAGEPWKRDEDHPLDRALAFCN